MNELELAEDSRRDAETFNSTGESGVVYDQDEYQKMLHNIDYRLKSMNPKWRHSALNQIMKITKNIESEACSLLFSSEAFQTFLSLLSESPTPQMMNIVGNLMSTPNQYSDLLITSGIIQLILNLILTEDKAMISAILLIVNNLIVISRTYRIALIASDLFTYGVSFYEKYPLANQLADFAKYIFFALKLEMESSDSIQYDILEQTPNIDKDAVEVCAEGKLVQSFANIYPLFNLFYKYNDNAVELYGLKAILLFLPDPENLLTVANSDFLERAILILKRGDDALTAIVVTILGQLAYGLSIDLGFVDLLYQSGIFQYLIDEISVLSERCVSAVLTLIANSIPDSQVIVEWVLRDDIISSIVGTAIEKSTTVQRELIWLVGNLTLESPEAGLQIISQAELYEQLVSSIEENGGYAMISMKAIIEMMRVDSLKETNFLEEFAEHGGIDALREIEDVDEDENAELAHEVLECIKEYDCNN